MPQKAARRAGPARSFEGILLAALLVSASTAMAQVAPAQLGGGGQPVPNETDSDLHSLYYSAHLPIDRRLAQELEQASRFFASGRYSEGLPLLDRVLAANEDTFELSYMRDSSAVATSLKSAAEQLLVELPSAGVAALELHQGVRARRALQEAIADRSLAAIATVARRYPVTQAATDGLLILAQAEMDVGRFGTAAAIYEQLLQWPKAAAQHEALLAVRLVWCYAMLQATDDYEVAVDRLRKLSSPTRRAEVASLIGTDQLDDWLAELSSPNAVISKDIGNEGWLMEGRNLARNPAYADGGIPHVWPTWEARTVKQINVASRLEARVDWQHRRGAPWGLVASPIAVGNYVILRTPTNLVAVDWSSGRRVWETRPETMEDEENSLSLRYEIANQQGAVSLDAIDQRLWLDAVYGGLSSDGQRVFAIQNLDSVQLRRNSRFGIRAFGRQGDEFEEPGNTLAAYDLRTEGKRIWQINGDHDPNLAGCFFLGAPIGVGDSLFALAEFTNSIHLIELDAATGQVNWKQPLANLERSVLFDTGRRLAGGTPTYARGLVICPTGAGSVVAVDPVERSLEWAYRFEVDPEMATRQNAGWQQTFGVYQPTLTSGWQRNRAVVAGDSVLVTAPESEQLVCLKLATGEKRWAIDRNEHLYLAGIAGNRVVVVGNHHVSLYNLATGEPLVNGARIDLPQDATVAGLGVLSEDLLLLPLFGNQVASIDLASGKVDRLLSLREGYSVGNLAFHRGALLSQSTTAVTRFDQLSTLRSRLATGEPSALRIEGEVAWGDGDLDRAIDLFRQAHDQAPDDQLVRRRLGSALFAGLRSDYQRYRGDDQLLAELLSDTSQRIELLQLHIKGSLAAGDPPAAFQHALALYAIDREGLLDVDGTGHEVQAERWFAARLVEIWNAADPDLRQTIEASVSDRYREAMQAESTGELARFVRYFGVVPAARDARLELAKRWVAANRVAEAELLLLQTDPGEQVAQFAGVSAGDALPFANQLLPTGPTSPPAGEVAMTLEDWPDGRVEVKVDPGRVGSDTSSNFGSNTQSRNRNNVLLMVEPLWCGVGWSGPTNLAISYGSPTQLIGWNRLGEVSQLVPLPFAALQNANTNAELTSIRFGHFAVLGAGTDVAAIDLRTGKLEQGPLLWASDPEPNSRNRAIRAMQLRGSTYIEVGDQNLGPRGPNGELCAAAPLGVVVRNDDLLRCFDPVDGDLLWQRRGVPASGPAFGDWQYLFLVVDGESTGTVVSMIDGTIVGNWQSPEGKTLRTCGRHMVVSLYRQGRRVIRVVDALNGEVLFEKDYSSKAKFTERHPSVMACMEPSGEFDVLDMTTGRLKFSQQLDPERGLESVHLLDSDDTLFVATNNRSAAQHNTAGNQALDNAPVVTGSIYALDAASGAPRWPRPATVQGQGFWQLQPPGSPALVFISNWEDRKTNHQKNATRLLCLDKRSGRSLAREDQLREPDSNPWSMRIAQGNDPTVSIDLRHTMVTLRFTEDPRPPEPVALAEVEGGSRSRGTGLISIGRRIFGEAFNLTPIPPVTDDDD